MKVFTSKGKVERPIHNDNVDIIADKKVQIPPSSEKIEATSKTLLLASGGAYIRFKNGNIEIHAPGVIDMKAGSFPHAGPVSMDYPMPSLKKIKEECLCKASIDRSIYVVR